MGLAGSDAGIRVLGLYIGLFFLISIWLCSRWTGARAPILSVALLGSLPAFVFIVGANLAYGLASCLLVLSFGMIWRMVEFPSKSRVLWAGFTCLLFAHCVYYDIVFLCAMLSGAALVVIRRRQWQTLGIVVGMGAVSGASLSIYLPVIHRASVYSAMAEYPSFNFSMLWYKLGEALTARSSAHPDGPYGPEIWLWGVLFLGGSVAALVRQRARGREAQHQEMAAAVAVRSRADLALFCGVSMLFGTVGYLGFLLRLHYVTQTWYYVEMLCLCAISLDGLLGANWPALRPWGLLRIGFMVAMMTWGAGSVWEEAHTRRSNVDLIAAVLGQKAGAGDLIVVQSSWEGIAFNRYYHGRTRWVTVPPIDSHLVHRTDLASAMMSEPDPMAPVLREITDTLRGSNNVWIVGPMSLMHPNQLPPSEQPVKWWLTSLNYWKAQATVRIQHHALREEDVQISVDGPVSHLENLPVRRFSGYRPYED